MPRKDYKLFGITVWSIEVSDDLSDESDDEETIEKDIGTNTTLSGNDTPVFGFVTPFDWGEDEDI